jgi:hypothetical protein
MTKKELEQITKIENSGNVVFRVIEVEGFKCAVIDEMNGKNVVQVIPFNENMIYPKQYAVLEWSFVRKNKA